MDYEEHLGFSSRQIYGTVVKLDIFQCEELRKIKFYSLEEKSNEYYGAAEPPARCAPRNNQVI